MSIGLLGFETIEEAAARRRWVYLGVAAELLAQVSARLPASIYRRHPHADVALVVPGQGGPFVAWRQRIVIASLASSWNLHRS